MPSNFLNNYGSTPQLNNLTALGAAIGKMDPPARARQLDKVSYKTLLSSPEAFGVDLTASFGSAKQYKVGTSQIKPTYKPPATTIGTEPGPARSPKVSRLQQDNGQNKKSHSPGYPTLNWPQTNAGYSSQAHTGTQTSNLAPFNDLFKVRGVQSASLGDPPVTSATRASVSSPWGSLSQDIQKGRRAIVQDGKTVARGVQKAGQSVATLGRHAWGDVTSSIRGLPQAIPTFGKMAGNAIAAAIQSDSASQLVTTSALQGAMGDKSGAQQTQNEASRQYQGSVKNWISAEPGLSAMAGGTNGVAGKSLRTLGYLAHGNPALARETAANIIHGIGKDAWNSPITFAASFVGMGEAGLRLAGTMSKIASACRASAKAAQLAGDVDAAAAAQAQAARLEQGVEKIRTTERNLAAKRKSQPVHDRHRPAKEHRDAINAQSRHPEIQHRELIKPGVFDYGDKTQRYKDYQHHHIEAPKMNSSEYKKAMSINVLNENSGGRVQGGINAHTGKDSLQDDLREYQKLVAPPGKEFHDLPKSEQKIATRRYMASLGIPFYK